ncbi:MAG: DUF4956 domain-containing protein, partial [Gemmatimonadaceae bacterium]
PTPGAPGLEASPMSTGTAGGRHVSAATKVIARVAVYYAALLGLAAYAWHLLPRMQLSIGGGLDALLGRVSAGDAVPRGAAAASFGDATLAATVAVAMLAAALLSLPVSWVYLLTRAKRGYQQSVVQTLIMLPVVVAGIVVLVKDSLALAFALAGIVAAVRFRTALDDSKDAVYVFLATGIGLAAAVNLPVAAVISIFFNAAILMLWRTDFGRTPVHLEGRLAERRLQRARELARTGTFVARIDDEVFRDMTAEQLEGIAERARRRAQQHDPEIARAEADGADGRGPEAHLFVRTRDVAEARGAVEPRLGEHAKRWRFGGAVPGSDGTHVLEYVLALRKGARPNELVEQLRSAATPSVIAAELE